MDHPDQANPRCLVVFDLLVKFRGQVVGRNDFDGQVRGNSDVPLGQLDAGKPTCTDEGDVGPSDQFGSMSKALVAVVSRPDITRLMFITEQAEPIERTKTKTGLTVTVDIISGYYPTGAKTPPGFKENMTILLVPIFPSKNSWGN